MFAFADYRKRRAKFTKEEDEQLVRLVKKFGSKCWEEISKHMPRRCGRQCRDRYYNYLVQNFKKGPWQPEEDQIILDNYGEIGPHWVVISKLLRNRSGNDVKNRWHKILSKRNNEISSSLSEQDRSSLNLHSSKKRKRGERLADMFDDSSSDESSLTESDNEEIEIPKDERVCSVNNELFGIPEKLALDEVSELFSFDESWCFTDCGITQNPKNAFDVSEYMI